MKLKADFVNAHPSVCPDADAIIQALNSRKFAGEVVRRVVGPHLKSPKPGPAEFYLQECDMAVSLEDAAGVEVRLSGVSGPTTATRRSIDDYANALTELVAIYMETIERLLTQGYRIQLFVTLMTDTPVPYKGQMTTLLESEPFWIKGYKNGQG